VAIPSIANDQEVASDLIVEPFHEADSIADISSVLMIENDC